MRKWTLILLFLASCWSCNNDEIRPEDPLIGHWDLGYSRIGSVQELSPVGGISYDFRSDKTFIKKLGTFDWRDEGTYTYKEDLRIVTFTYRTYTNQPSDTKTMELNIEKINDKELVFKVDYNDTNISGEFVEFKFIHYFKK